MILRIRFLARLALFVAPVALVAVASLEAVVCVHGQDTPRGKKFALLVAVDRYEKGSLLPSLRFPRRDIEDVARLFLESGYDKENVVVMTKERGTDLIDLIPTAANVRKHLGLLRDQLKPGDSVIVCLAGHGAEMLAPPHDNPQGEPRPRGFFCTMDANLARSRLETFVSFDELYAGLAATKATTKLLLVDACHNERIAMPPPPPPPEKVAAIFSCSEHEVSWEDAELGGGRSVFFHYVIEGLEGSADLDGDRKVSLKELAQYTKQTVSQFVRQKHGVSQLPLVRGDIGPVALSEVTARPLNPRSLTNSIGMKFALLDAGEFQMGSDATDPAARDDEFLDKSAGRKEKHRVRITRPFYLGIHEVTRGQFRRFVAEVGYQTEAEKFVKEGPGRNEDARKRDPYLNYTWQNASFDQTDEHPVVNVSWNDAIAFAQWLSRKEGVTYRLPTEAEWEYACRAGTISPYCFGEDPEGIAAVGNVPDGTAKEEYSGMPAIADWDGYVYTAPVGRFRANAWGLFDMHGNVFEWCLDGFDAGYYKHSPVDDPRGVEGTTDRVVRGGAWDGVPYGARSARRGGLGPDLWYRTLGFRLARVPSVR